MGTLERGLRVLEAIAERQPIGLTELSCALGEDKSALQRVLATLHAAGWIRPLAVSPPRWTLSTKSLVVSGQGLLTASLPVRARPLLSSLRDATGETAHLALVDGSALIVADVAEGKQIVRTGLRPGQVHPPRTSAASRAVCACLSPELRIRASGSAEGLLTEAEYTEIRARGWSLSEGTVQRGMTSIAGAVTDSSGAPAGVVVVSGPDTRLTPPRYTEIGALVRDTVAELSSMR